MNNDIETALRNTNPYCIDPGVVTAAIDPSVAIGSGILCQTTLNILGYLTESAYEAF